MKSFLKYFKGLSILWKFTIIYFILIVLPAIIIEASFYGKSVNFLEETSRKMTQDAISQIKYNILYSVKNCESLSSLLTNDSQLQIFLNSDFKFNSNNIDYLSNQVVNKIDTIKQLNPNFYRVRIYSVNDSIPEVYDVIYNLDRIKDKNYYSRVIQSDYYQLWGGEKKLEEYFSANPTQNDKFKEEQGVLPLYTLINSTARNKLLGVLEIDILEQDILSLFKDIQKDKNDYFALMDCNGKILSTDGNHQQSNEELKSQLTVNSMPGNSGSREIKLNGQVFTVYYDTINEMGFKILAFVSQKEFSNKVTTYKTSLIIFIFIGVIGIFLITYIITKFLFRRFKVLIKMMKKIQNGELDVRINEDSSDEIGELAHSFNTMAQKLEGVIVDLIETETAQRDAEIRALQSQINPHFFYNVLENIKMECEIREQLDLASTITSLGKIFRYNMKWDSKFVSLAQELEHVENYISVMKIRFRDTIEYHHEIEEGLFCCTVIKMILQPITENCFQHAFKGEAGKWRIEILVRKVAECLEIEVKDNGIGINDETLEEINQSLIRNISIIGLNNSGTRIGLSNINKRIKVQFGNEYGITVKSKLNVGTTVCISFPYDAELFN